MVGIDPQGREILRFIQGDIGLHADPRLLWTDRMLVATGRMLRSFHDAQRGFDAPMDIPWNPIGREPQGIPEVICHNDFAPYNCICRSGELVAMIDFDLAAPGSRVWDLAWSTINWIPLFDPQDHPRQRPDPPESQRRLRLLAKAYGLEVSRSRMAIAGIKPPDGCIREARLPGDRGAEPVRPSRRRSVRGSVACAAPALDAAGPPRSAGRTPTAHIPDAPPEDH
jgi:hypothetical protein